MIILRQDSFQHKENYPFYTLCEHEISNDESIFTTKCYSIICEYDVHELNIFSYDNLKTAEITFNMLIDNCRA